MGSCLQSKRTSLEQVPQDIPRVQKSSWRGLQGTPSPLLWPSHPPSTPPRPRPLGVLGGPLLRTHGQAGSRVLTVAGVERGEG